MKAMPSRKISCMLKMEIQDRVAIVTLDRPPANAIDSETLDQLDAVCEQLECDEAIGAAVVRGGDTIFCAGVDIHMIGDLLAQASDGSKMLDFVRRIQSSLARWRRIPIPTIAAVTGSATGGGLELAMSCDVRIASLRSRMGLTEVNIGLLPGAGGTQLLTRLAGPGVASRLILSGELVDGATAADLGIVHFAVDPQEVDTLARDWGLKLASKSRAAVREIKRCLALAPSSEGFAAEIDGSARLLGESATSELVGQFFSRSRS